MTKAQQKDRDEAIAKLRELCPPGTTVYCVLRHVARSGMSCNIDFYLMTEDGPFYLSGYIASALGMRRAKDRGLVVQGCGMDMGFHVVYNLSSALWQENFECLGKGKCPSNDHSNDPQRAYRIERGLEEPRGDEVPRDQWYSPDRQHSDGGYALRSRWI